MSEQAIFLAAVEISDPAERQAYVLNTCAGDEELRRQVESLLAAHEKSGEFLDRPALEQVAESAPGTVAVDGRRPVALGDTQAEPLDDGTEDRALDFLQLSTKPGVLGRLGHYEVLEVLGQGGFGTVVKAFDEKLHRMVAIKIMSPQLAATSPARKRFMREARSSAAVRHENVVDIHAIEEQPIPFLVMEYVAGETLQQRLDRHGPLDAAEVLRIGVQIAHGLAAAHAMGKIHRDIKPANILLENGIDRVKITDFGLARAADDASLTQSGMIAGTPMYMAPEQAQGVALDHRADLFSFGSVLYVMCSGRPPFRAASTLAVLKRVAEDTPRPVREIIPEVPQWLCDVISRLHAKNPDDRFQNAKEVADLLGRYLTDLQMHGKVTVEKQAPRPEKSVAKSAGVETTLEPPTPAPARSKFRWVAALVILLLASLVVLAWTESTGVTTVLPEVLGRLSSEGTVVVLYLGDPDVKVSIEGEGIVMEGVGRQEFRVRPGEYKVLARRAGQVVQQRNVVMTRRGWQAVTFSGGFDTVAKVESKKEPKHIRGGSKAVLRLDANSKMDMYGIRLGAGDFTVEGFFTLDEEKSARVLLLSETMLEARYGKDEHTWHFSVKQQIDNRIVGTSAKGGLPKVGERTHVAGVKTASELRLFVNGRLVATEPWSGEAHAQSPQGRLGFWAPGIVEEVRISNVARYAKDFTPATRHEPDNDTLALYHLDEGDGDKVTDSSVNRRHGKLVGAKWVKAESTPVAEYALKFDDDSRVILPSLKVDHTLPFTVECWVKPHQADPIDSRPLVRIAERSALRVAGATGKQWTFSLGDSAKLHAPLRHDYLVHVAAVRAKGELRLYLDGKLASKGTLSPDIAEGVQAIAHIGGAEKRQLPSFAGIVNTVRISKAARYDQDFTPAKRFDADKDTLALYHFDEGTGDVLKDSSGNNHHGKIVGAKWVKADGTPIVPLLRFESQTKGNVPSLYLDLSKPFTVEGYFTQSESVPFPRGLVPLRFEKEFSLHASHGWGIGVSQLESNHSIGVSTSQLYVGRRLHLAVVSPGNKELLIFLNGRLKRKFDLTSGMPARKTTHPLEFHSFMGIIEEVRISTVARYDQDFIPAQRFETDKDTLALYHLDEGQGDVLKDSSGNNHHGKIVGATWVKADGTPIVATVPVPAPAYGLRLGVASSIKMPTLTLDKHGPITMEAYVTPTVLEDQPRSDKVLGFGKILYLEAVGPRLKKLNTGWYFAYGISKLDDSRAGPAPLVGKRRIHLAGVYDGKNLRLFLDGKLMGSKQKDNIAKGLAKKDTSFFIGDGFDGLIEEVRISKVARYDKDFTPEKRFTPDQDTLALYHFNEGTGDVLNDTSGNNHHGKIVGATWVKADGTPIVAPPSLPVKADGTPIVAPPSLPRFALDFDGVASRVDIPTLARDEDSPITIEAFVTLSQPKGGILVRMEGKYPCQLYGWPAPGSANDWVANGIDHRGLKFKKGTPAISVGKLTHLALQISDTKMELFIDGKKGNSIPRATGDPAEQFRGSMLGGQRNAKKNFSDFFAGTLHQVRISNVLRYAGDFKPSIGLDPDKFTLALYQMKEGQGDKLTDSSGNEHHGKIDDAKWVKADGSPIVLAPVADPERSAAEWVLSVGGTVQASVDGTVILKAADLPAEPIRLAYINLRANLEINDKELARFKDLKHLQILHLEFTKITDAGLANFKHCNNLLSLNLGGEDVTDAGLAHFKENKNLTQLCVYRAKVGDAGLAHFKGSTKITTLGLSGTQVTDAGLVNFAACKDLSTLDLSKTAIGDAGLAHLKDCAKLTQLNLMETKVTPAKIEELKKALPKCKIEWDDGI